MPTFTKGRGLYLTFSGVQVCASLTDALLGNEAADDDMVTFADVANGTDRVWAFSITGVADYAQGSLWSLLWDTGKYVPVPYVFKPYGNAAATAAQPHFTGDVLVDAKPPIGGSADAFWKFDARLVCTAPPLRVTA